MTKTADNSLLHFSSFGWKRVVALFISPELRMAMILFNALGIVRKCGRNGLRVGSSVMSIVQPGRIFFNESIESAAGSIMCAQQ